MKKTTYLLVIITFLLIWIIITPSCKKEDSNNNDDPDTTTYFTFGQIGNQWTLRIYDNPVTCEYTCEITGDHGDGVFDILYKEGNCDWNPETRPGYFYLTPVEWREMFDENSEHGITLLRRDALVGTTYQYVDTHDTIIVTVIDLNDKVSVPAGEFNCVKVRKEGRIHSSYEYTYEAYYWINYKYGLIKIETIYGTWDQELVSANW